MDSIEFPNLHIKLDNVGRGIEIFGFSIAYYGMVIALGILIALWFIIREAKRLGYDQEAFFDVFFAGVICGILGARIYYVIFYWELYKDNLISIFNLRQGGLAIYGGIIFGTLGVLLMAKKKGIGIFAATDVVIPGVLIGQIMGRWGNFFNREAFGGYSNGLFTMRLPIDSVRSSSDITDQMLENAVVADNITYVDVHPTFLYESLFNLCVLVILLVFRKHKKWDGQIFCLYLFFYGIGRFIIEGLRTDQLMLFNTGLPVSRVVSVCLVILAVAWYNYKYFFKTKKG